MTYYTIQEDKNNESVVSFFPVFLDSLEIIYYEKQLENSKFNKKCFSKNRDIHIINNPKCLYNPFLYTKESVNFSWIDFMRQKIKKYITERYTIYPKLNNVLITKSDCSFEHIKQIKSKIMCILNIGPNVQVFLEQKTKNKLCFDRMFTMKNGSLLLLSGAFSKFNSYRFENRYRCALTYHKNHTELCCDKQYILIFYD